MASQPQDPSWQAVEDAARTVYDRCHPDDSFDDLKRRAAFSKEDRCLLRDWLAAAGAGHDMLASPAGFGY